MRRCALLAALAVAISMPALAAGIEANKKIVVNFYENALVTLLKEKSPNSRSEIKRVIAEGDLVGAACPRRARARLARHCRPVGQTHWTADLQARSSA